MAGASYWRAKTYCLSLATGRGFLLVGRRRHTVSASHSFRQHLTWPGRSVCGPPARGPVLPLVSPPSHTTTHRNIVSLNTLCHEATYLCTPNTHTVYMYTCEHCITHFALCSTWIHAHTLALFGEQGPPPPMTNVLSGH